MEIDTQGIANTISTESFIEDIPDIEQEDQKNDSKENDSTVTEQSVQSAPNVEQQIPIDAKNTNLSQADAPMKKYDLVVPVPVSLSTRGISTKQRPPSQSVSFASYSTSTERPSPLRGGVKKWTVNVPVPLATSRTPSPLGRRNSISSRDTTDITRIPTKVPTFFETLEGSGNSHSHSTLDLSPPSPGFADCSLSLMGGSHSALEISAISSSFSASNDGMSDAHFGMTSPRKAAPPVPSKSAAVQAALANQASPSTSSISSSHSLDQLSPPETTSKERRPMIPPKNVRTGTFREDIGTPAEEPLDIPKVRAHLALELLKTEQFYVRSLRTICSAYMEPMKASLETNDPILPAELQKQLFSNVDVLLNIHQSFLQNIEELVADWNNTTKLGQAFLSILRFFKTYVPYINNYNQSMEVYLVSMKKKAFKKFMHEAAVGNELDNWPSYCIQPVQRIPKYLILLAEMLRYTNASHPDYEDLKMAHDALTIVAQEINTQKREAENLNQCAVIQNSMSYPDGVTKIELLNQTRRYIRQGQVELFLNSLSTTYNYLILFNDCLLITKAKRKHFHYHGILFLQHCTITHSPEDATIDIKSTAVAANLHITFPTEEESSGWMADIQSAAALRFSAPNLSTSSTQPIIEDYIHGLSFEATDDSVIGLKRHKSLGASDSKQRIKRLLTLGVKKSNKPHSRNNSQQTQDDSSLQS